MILLSNIAHITIKFVLINSCNPFTIQNNQISKTIFFLIVVQYDTKMHDALMIFLT